MPAPKGNQFWKARSSHGANPKFSDSKVLWKACCEYFQWVEDHPLEEGIVYQGEVMEKGNSLMRAMTESGLCIFLDICTSTWNNYKSNVDLMAVTTRAAEIIYNQKFAGASAGLLNANIIARDLGLADKKDNTITGPDGGPIQLAEVIFNPVDSND